MPSFKIYLSDWNGIIERSIPKTVEADSQFQAIVQYMSEIEKNNIATHIVVTGGLSHNLRVFTIREFNESMARKPHRTKVIPHNTDSKDGKPEFKQDSNLVVEKGTELGVEADKFKVEVNQFLVCLFRNGLQFTKLVRIDGESYSDALDTFLRSTKDKAGSFLHENNIWIKNAYGDNRWHAINNHYAIEYSKNVRYQRAIKESNSIEITVFNSQYRDGGENKFKVVAHDAADAFRMYFESHKEEYFPVSLFYLNKTTSESRNFDSSDYLVFVRGINSTKDVDYQLFKQFQFKDYSTIEYYFESNKSKTNIMEKIAFSSEEELVEIYWSLVLKSANEFMIYCLNDDSFSLDFKTQNKDKLLLKLIMFEISIMHSYALCFENHSFGPTKLDVPKLIVEKLFNMVAVKYHNNKEEFKSIVNHTYGFKEYTNELWTDLQNMKDQFFFPKSSLKALQILFSTKEKSNDITCILKIFDHANAMLFAYHEIGKNLISKSKEQKKPLWKFW